MTRISPLILGALLALGLAANHSASAAGAFSSLEERMSSSEFKAAGLDKLTPEELAALNAWLQGRTAGSAAAAAAPPPVDDRIGFRDSPSPEGVISRIQGEFNGWDGKTKFVLENGQVWQQAEASSLRGVRMDSPLVRIEPAFMGSWLLSVEGYNTKVRVRRVK